MPTRYVNVRAMIAAVSIHYVPKRRFVPNWTARSLVPHDQITDVMQAYAAPYHRATAHLYKIVTNFTIFGVSFPVVRRIMGVNHPYLRWGM
jgi:hypothetical protein